MNTEDIKSLLDRYIAGQCTEKEKALLETWYNNDRQKFLPELTEEEIDSDLQLILEQLPGPYINKVVPLWKRLTVAAAAVAAIILGVWLYNISHTPRHPEFISGPPLANDVAPGRNTATLTLAGGKVINLDTNKTSVVVTDSVKTFVMLTASTPRGGQYQITLPDGTAVWLNADSKITFPSQFTGAKRRITLEGEAYFQVAKDKKHPFIVESKGQQVTVLGTHFNINAYPDETSTKTTLLEGSVKINDATVLKPGQQSVLTDNRGIKVQQVSPSEVIDWKNGNFVFRDEPLEELMLRVSRWYDLEIIYAAGASRDIPLSGAVSRSRPLSSLLEGIQATAKVKFKIEGKKLYIYK